MKTKTKFIIAGLATALVTAVSSFASDSEWYIIDNHHGAITYQRRPAEKTATIAFGGSAMDPGRSPASLKRAESKPIEPKTVLREFVTPHGTLVYFAPTN